MSPEGKRRLNTTMRGLRERLLTDLQGAVEGTYRLTLPVSHAALPEARRLRRARLERWLDEQARGSQGPTDVLRARFLFEVVERAAATLD